MLRHTLCALTLSSALALAPAAHAGLEEGIAAANVGDFETALSEFQYLADMGYAPGIYQLAQMYESGHGVAKNQRKAAQLYQQAVDKDYADAMFSLAVMYQEGRGVKLDLQRAVSLFKGAAEKGLAAAQFNLGVMYTNGEGVIKDYQSAIDWYRKAAAQNYTLAQFNLALMYYEGLGVAKSIEKSYIWNTIAEYNGNDDASTSRKLDEKKLQPEEIERAKQKADDIYEKILAGRYAGEGRRL
ncbi:tetratricopeptide repeat protein [Pseudoalteromonas ruthenica]|uniref:Protein prenylyltransferase domain-containing protein n=1 Tax=Pseudoalteromonas ruthenica TaxID=151081 RepID=A0A0F4PJV5_9GAMM|nr:tetratricopeptide repeat protein [Pseudoalteromonas ruthenica]KJY94501.1 protein prenylyltransferase domain-containing protein [Pseudoalteromonas ruthenica]KJZ00596.1 protein prenylyltransferase domain-containing protein [Pseudoalteromonas ruthenica]TMO89749.1 sel1 repeat family protein [Pseudoalteromonas ruthenica]TMO92175.1 sel1 repeat family protein [Pseudoalteromonas ruthenica]TMP01321.1 sel1 repeat family protein [Pseudoalteromonas ruthenica]